MPSERFQDLKRQIAQLRKLFLPRQFDSTGTYRSPERVAARAIAFRVLAHAELETYFEDRVISIAKKALAAWESDRRVSSVTVHLMGYSEVSLSLPPETLRAASKNVERGWHNERITLNSRVSNCVSTYVHRVMKENHGVKEKNVLAMLLPIGFDVAKMDELLLANLNQFGEARGQAAHSSRLTVTVHSDPKDEYEKVKRLLSDLECVDIELDRIASEVAKQHVPQRRLNI